ncbi:MAG: MATE family efflux transporter [Gammaproteobacteria bacterium]|nr:MATE family efflux transporter [Gammaproteobacteria bacterium]
MNNPLITAREARTLAGLAVPMTGVALVNMGMSITDTVMMGWISPMALATGAVISDLYSIIFYFLGGILGAVSPLLAQALGAGRVEEVRPTLHNAFAMAAVIAVPAAAGVALLPVVLGVFGVDREIIALGGGYALGLALTVVPMIFATVWRHAFYAIGRPRVYLTAVLMLLPLNALADYVLMFGWGPVPAFGLAGAGFASALVAIGLVAYFAWFTVRDPAFRAFGLFTGSWEIDPSTLRRILRLGLPIGATTLGEVGIYLLSTVIISLFGVLALAAHAIALRFAGVLYAVFVGLAHATTVRVGYAVGRADIEQTRTAIRTAITTGTAIGLLILAVTNGWSSAIPWLFLDSADPSANEVAATASGLLMLLGIMNAAQGPASPATAVLRAFKDTRAPMGHYLIGYWLVGLPVGCIAAFPLGYESEGVWFGLATGMITTAVLVTMRLLRYNGSPATVDSPA